MAIAPTLAHQRLLVRFLLVLGERIEQQRLGVLLMAPYDFVISSSPACVRQPDLFFIAQSRFKNWKEIMNLPRLDTPPDLIIEILTPMDEPLRWAQRLHDYHRFGVPEVWAVNMRLQAIETLTRREGGYDTGGVFHGEERIQSEVLKGIDFCPAEVFG